MFQDFIILWVGKDYLFSYNIVIVLIACFYFTGLRNSVFLFKEALGLYWQDRYKAFFEAVINLTFSIIFAKTIGVVGVFIGTLVSTLCTCFWIEPYVLYKHGFNQSCGDYFKRVFKSTSVAIMTFIIISFICKFINYSPLLNLIIKFVISSIIMLFVYYIIYGKSAEVKYFKDILINIKRKLIK